MSEDDYFPNYRQHLQKVFSYIAGNEIIRRRCGELASSSNLIYNNLSSFDSDRYWTFEISPPWRIDIKDNEYFDRLDASLLIGGEMVAKNNDFVKFSFYAGIVRNSCPSGEPKTKYDSCCEPTSKGHGRIVRNFHFDTCPGVLKTLETKSHVQFGGWIDKKKPIVDINGKEVHYCLDNTLDLPRLPFPPLDIVLLFDLLVRQFRTVIDKGFAERQDWIRFVRASEDFRLKRYYDRIADYYKGKAFRRKDEKIKTLFEVMCEDGFRF